MEQAGLPNNADDGVGHGLWECLVRDHCHRMFHRKSAIDLEHLIAKPMERIYWGRRSESLLPPLKKLCVEFQYCHGDNLKFLTTTHFSFSIFFSSSCILICFRSISTSTLPGRSLRGVYRTVQWSMYGGEPIRSTGRCPDQEPPAPALPGLVVGDLFRTSLISRERTHPLCGTIFATNGTQRTTQTVRILAAN